jgi:hypothetical protein
MTRAKVREPARPAVEIAEQLHLVRQLIAVADQQLDKAKHDLGIARVGLADIEAELLSRGVDK